MNDEKQSPHGDYSVDEILAEAHILKENGSAGSSDGQKPQPQKAAAPLSADEIVQSARSALNMEVGGGTPEPSGPEKEPRKKKSLFHRKKKQSADEEPDDIYYGLQLKSLEEYRREYEETIESGPDQSAESDAAKRSSFPYLFNGSPDEDLSESFEKIHRDRQDRLEKIMEHAGLDSEEMFGVNSAAQRPKIPPAPVKPPVPPVKGPPVPPAVQPGPAIEPESNPPIVEPPAQPAPVVEQEEPAPIAEREEPAPIAEREEPAPIAEREEPAPIAEREEPAPIAEREEPAPIAEWEEPAPIAEREEPAPIAEREEPAPITKQEKAVSAAAEPTAPVKEPEIPPRAKDERPAPPPEREPKDRSVPRYRADDLPLHVIVLGGFEDILAAEAASYVSAPPEVPEPISFPVSSRAGGKVENPIRTESDQQEEAAPEEIPKIRTLPVRNTRQPEPPQTKKRFRFFGSDEDNNDPLDEPLPDEEELDDYSNPADAPSVLNDLSANVRRLFLRFAVTAICAVITAVFSIAWEHASTLPPELHSLFNPQACLTVHLIFLLVAAGFCAPAVWNGIRGLFRFQANADSAAAVAVAAAVIQNVVFFISGFPTGMHLYTSLAAAALLLNTAGKLSMSRRILRNFRYISSPVQKFAVQIYDDYNTSLQLANGCTVGEPEIAYQCKTGFLKNFLSLSYAPDPSDHVSQVMAPIGFIASLGLCIVSAILSKNAATALTVFAASACVCVPFANTLSVGLPLARIGKISAHCGAMSVGWPAVEQFSRVNAVMVDAKDLFPRGTVVLNGIQTFAGQRIDEAITDATALATCAGGPLSDLFSQIVKSHRKDILPKVERPAYEDGKGISGTVSDRLILVGNRELLLNHGIDAPSRDYEDKYIRAGKVPVYLAAGGLLVAMFLVSYRSDRSRTVELRRMEYNGVSLIVRTRDPNVTPALVAQCFGISEHSVSILPDRLGDIYGGLITDPPDRAPAVMATKGRAVSMMRLLAACIRQKSNISIAVALQAAGAALGFALTAFFAVYAGLGQLSATALLVFEAFWAVAVLLVPKLRRP